MNFDPPTLVRLGLFVPEEQLFYIPEIGSQRKKIKNTIQNLYNR